MWSHSRSGKRECSELIDFRPDTLSNEAVMSIGSSPFLTADVDGMVGIGGGRATRNRRVSTEIAHELSDARMDELRWRVLSGYYDLVDVTEAIAARIIARTRRHDRE